MDPTTLLQMLMGISPAQAAPNRALEYEVPGPQLTPPMQQPYVPPVPPAPEAPSMFDSRTWMRSLFPEAPTLINPTMAAPLPEPTVAPPSTMPTMSSKPIEPYMTDPLIAGTVPAPSTIPIPRSRPVSLGASLEPSVPMPKPRPIEAPTGTIGSPTGSNGLVNALKGVVGPAAPTAQKVSTPHAPPMAKMAGGNVAELLASLGIGPQQAFPGLKLPSTLGQALGGR